MRYATSHRWIAAAVALVRALGDGSATLPFKARARMGIDELCLVQRGATLLAPKRATGGASAEPAPQSSSVVGDTTWTAANQREVGTNVGGWFALEDWIFSGANGSLVGSPQNLSQGICLPPLVPQTEPWPSEGILTKRLVERLGAKSTVAAFVAHRNTFVQAEDFRQMASLGIRYVRVPLSWAAFADALAPISPEHYGTHDPWAQVTVVPDPFHSDEAAFVTVPRRRLVDVLRMAGDHGLKVLFSFHTMPGGSSYAAYNGVWPLWPAFWRGYASLGNHSERKVPLRDVGLWLSAALIKWVEGLEPNLQRSVLGLTLMNEPAHQAARQLREGSPFADESDVWQWLAASSDQFRRSSLPAKGIRLYGNLIESAFMDHSEMVSWWANTFTKSERETWAVIDIHWYSAWSSGECDGRIDYGGGYSCDQPLSQIRGVMHDCVRGFAKHYASTYDGLKALSEFSLGTYQDARFACQDAQTLHMFLDEQVAAFKDNGIVPFYWTWRMPYGSAFENGWSLKRSLGKEQQSSTPCG